MAQYVPAWSQTFLKSFNDSYNQLQAQKFQAAQQAKQQAAIDRRTAMQLDASAEEAQLNREHQAQLQAERLGQEMEMAEEQKDDAMARLKMQLMAESLRHQDSMAMQQYRIGMEQRRMQLDLMTKMPGVLDALESRRSAREAALNMELAKLNWDERNKELTKELGLTDETWEDYDVADYPAWRMAIEAGLTLGTAGVGLYGSIGKKLGWKGASSIGKKISTQQAIQQGARTGGTAGATRAAAKGAKEGVETAVEETAEAIAKGTPKGTAVSQGAKAGAEAAQTQRKIWTGKRIAGSIGSGGALLAEFLFSRKEGGMPTIDPVTGEEKLIYNPFNVKWGQGSSRHGMHAFQTHIMPAINSLKAELERTPPSNGVRIAEIKLEMQRVAESAETLKQMHTLPGSTKFDETIYHRLLHPDEYPGAENLRQIIDFHVGQMYQNYNQHVTSGTNQVPYNTIGQINTGTAQDATINAARIQNSLQPGAIVDTSRPGNPVYY